MILPILNTKNPMNLHYNSFQTIMMKPSKLSWFLILQVESSALLLIGLTLSLADVSYIEAWNWFVQIPSKHDPWYAKWHTIIHQMIITKQS